MSRHESADVAYAPVVKAPQIVLNPEELRVLKECNSEAFYKRGVPGAVAFCAGAYYATKFGLLKPHASLGMIPALAVSGIIGCVTGSLSYKSVCLERVLAVPNGTLRQQIEAMQGIKRDRIGPTDLPPEKLELDLSQAPMVSGSQMDIYSSNHDFDGFTGVNTDGDQLSNYDTTKPLPKYNSGLTTYDDLRQRNREEYARSSAGRQNFPPQRPAQPGPLDYPPQPRPSAPIFEDTRPFDRDRVPQYQLD